MKVLRDRLDQLEPHFGEGGKLHRFYYAWDAIDTILYTPSSTTRSGSHVRDGLDLKRMMLTVVAAMLPVQLMALYNTGLQAFLAIEAGAQPLDNLQTLFYSGWLGLPFDPGSIMLCMLYGALYFVPVMVAGLIGGGTVEMIFATVRRHEVNEGFLVTSALIPLILPPTIPLWMTALLTAIGIMLAKEIFGGTGMNFLNPALTIRAMLFFAYPAYMSGVAPWIAADFEGVDNFTGATLLLQATEDANALGPVFGEQWFSAFFGFIPGSMGETSALACLLGAGILIMTRIGSWRTMAGVVLGTFIGASMLNAIGSDTNPMFAMPFMWHIVLGGWALGTVFMATDPVSSAFTERGKLFYGLGIGLLVVLIRVVNPAYPEGMMLAILFMNMFAPLIDHFVVKANIRRRKARYAA
jgi:Na+-transporting NADH:ubiquinone oxidoreductase subunit B